MTEKTSTKHDSVLEIIYRRAEENYFNFVLKAVLTDYEPKNKLLAIALESKESTAVEMLKGKDFKYNTDPKSLVQWHVKNSRNPDEYDVGSFLINRWVLCRQIRHYLNEGNAEMAALFAMYLERDAQQVHEFLAGNEKNIQQHKKKQQTLPANIAKQKQKLKRLELTYRILVSEGYTPFSLEKGHHNARRKIFERIKNELEKIDKKLTVGRGTFNTDLQELREIYSEVAQAEN